MDQKTRLRIHQVVLVEWIDADVNNSWIAKEEIDHEFIPNVTIGFLLHQDKNQYVISSTYDPEGEYYNATIRIPSAWVIRVETISTMGFRDGKRIKAKKSSRNR